MGLEMFSGSVAMKGHHPFVHPFSNHFHVSWGVWWGRGVWLKLIPGNKEHQVMYPTDCLPIADM